MKSFTLVVLLAFPLVARAEDPAEVASPTPASQAQPAVFDEGRLAGVDDARDAPVALAWGGCGLAGGTLCSAPGCLGATSYAAISSPRIGKRADDPEWLRGYEQGYRNTIKKRRATWAATGGTIGTLAGVTAYLVWAYQQPRTQESDSDVFDAVGMISF